MHLSLVLVKTFNKVFVKISVFNTFFKNYLKLGRIVHMEQEFLICYPGIRVPIYYTARSGTSLWSVGSHLLNSQIWDKFICSLGSDLVYSQIWD